MQKSIEKNFTCVNKKVDRRMKCIHRNVGTNSSLNTFLELILEK